MEPSAAEATAFHEAGHAVMALALGRPVACVSVLPTREFLGTCEFGKAVFRPSEDWLEREALVALAGLAAEARRSGEYAWGGAAPGFAHGGEMAWQRGAGAPPPDTWGAPVLGHARSPN